jgi:hypothetical protein
MKQSKASKTASKIARFGNEFGTSATAVAAVYSDIYTAAGNSIDTFAKAFSDRKVTMPMIRAGESVAASFENGIADLNESSKIADESVANMSKAWDKLMKAFK